MKLIAQATINSGRQQLGQLRSFRVQSLTGTAIALFDNEQIDLSEGDSFELPAGFWKSVEVFAPAGSAATVLYGFASLGGGGSCAGQTLQGTAADPNAAGIVPPDANAAATYFADVASPALWNWSVSSKLWV